MKRMTSNGQAFSVIIDSNALNAEAAKDEFSGLASLDPSPAVFLLRRVLTFVKWAENTAPVNEDSDALTVVKNISRYGSC
jgi:hypothetical protein